MYSNPLFSIGHGTRPIEDFIRLLKAYNIDYIADLRSTPYSRFNPQYNRPPLVLALEKHGIRYVYMGDELGGRPNDPACYDANGKLDFEFVIHQTYFKRGIHRLQQALDRNLRIALLCSESRPDQCHRSRIVGKALAQLQIYIQHIDETGKIKDQKALHWTYSQTANHHSNTPQLFP